ncbi:MAG TPA: TldD/PmbA family protein [Ardenticatenaceae bacterium]|nr:TldD/PmbA family protein [Ardenticatenaceae bacterium]
MLPVESVRRILSTALQNGGDLAEVYLEKTEAVRLLLDDERLEESIQGNDVGGGVRVFYGNSAAYAYTDDLTEESLIDAARAAAAAARRTNQPRVAVDLSRSEPRLESPLRRPFDEMSIAGKAAILRNMDAAARRYSPYISQVQVGYEQVSRRVWIYNSEGLWAEDDREILEFRAQVTAQRGDVRQSLGTGLGAQAGLEFLDEHDPVTAIGDLAESVVQMLDARPAPAGEMPVVISNGWGGVLFHEACGHCMEADFVTTGASAYAGLVGQRVGPDFLTAVDDGTIPGRRGSMRFDDEGTPTNRTVLIENGILREYMWDLTEARRAGRSSTGNGRRQSFRYQPMPRMTNTFIAAGPHDPEEIIRSVQKGLYAKRLGGGQVEIGRGDYVFNITEGWLIEDGRLTVPVQGATLVGNGPETLRQIDMIGTDEALDPGFGMCGKIQGARVSVGQPTVRVPLLTVGGTER